MVEASSQADRRGPVVESLAPWFRAVCLLVFCVGLVLACYLAWKPSGSLGGLPGLPRGLSMWLDRHGVLRNLPAFAALAVPLLLVARAGRPRRRVVLGVAALAEFIEYAQLWQPGRHFDWRDIVVSLAGIGAAWGAVTLIEITGMAWGRSRQSPLPWPVIARPNPECRR